MLVIDLPYPPSVNTYWRRAGSRIHLTAKAREYRKRVIEAVQGAERMDGDLIVDIIATRPDRRRRDIDNIAKATLDAMQHAGVYEDDSQIVDLRSRWSGDVVPGGGLNVRITRKDN